MPTIFGPENPQFAQDRNANDTGWERIPGVPVCTNSETLRDAITAYESEFSLTVTRYDGSLAEVPFFEGQPPKYFWVLRKDGSGKRLVDIHVFREGREICPKQNLDFVLESGDILVLGELVC